MYIYVQCVCLDNAMVVVSAAKNHHHQFQNYAIIVTLSFDLARLFAYYCLAMRMIVEIDKIPTI